MLAAGGGHTVLLRSDGNAIAFGKNGAEECQILLLDEGRYYKQVSSYGNHTVLLRSELAPGLNYTQVATGYAFTLLLRSDGRWERWWSCGMRRR